MQRIAAPVPRIAPLDEHRARPVRQKNNVHKIITNKQTRTTNRAPRALVSRWTTSPATLAIAAFLNRFLYKKSQSVGFEP